MKRSGLGHVNAKGHGYGIANLQVLHAIPGVTEHGCPWRGLPARCGNRRTISTRRHRWAQSGVLARVCEQLQRERSVRVELAAPAPDSTGVQVPPDGTGALPKNGPPSLGRSRGGWTAKLHPAAADARTAPAFPLSPGQARDAPEGRQLRNRLGRRRGSPALVRDRACAGDETRQLASALGCEPAGPPLRTRIQPGEYDRELDQRRNASERLLRRWQGFRRSFSRFEKLDMVFLGLIAFALIVDALRQR